MLVEAWAGAEVESLDLAAARAFLLVARGSPLVSARWVAVRLRRRAKDSLERDIDIYWKLDWLGRLQMTFTRGWNLPIYKNWYCTVGWDSTEGATATIWVWGRKKNAINILCPFKENPPRNPPKPLTRGGGTGFWRVYKHQPVPLPLCTLPVTRAGLKTRDNHYREVSR